MFADYVIVGKVHTDEIWEISRTGMIKNTSEFTYLLFCKALDHLALSAARVLREDWSEQQ